MKTINSNLKKFTKIFAAVSDCNFPVGGLLMNVFLSLQDIVGKLDN